MYVWILYLNVLHRIYLPVLYFFYLVLTFAEVYMFCLWGLQQTLVSLILCSDCDNASAVFV